MKHSIVALSLLFAQTATAGEAVDTILEMPFDDALFALESAITEKGLKIDHVSHVGEMLDRTGADLGLGEGPYEKAEIMQFCSATLSREMMMIDVTNIRFCPYIIYIYSTREAPEQTVIGYESLPEGEMKKVETLLGEIVEAAAAF